MSQHRAERRCGVERMRIGGGLLIGALASGALAAGALSTAGQAQASCVSAGGWFSIGKGCETTEFGDFAFAIGPGATASATGGFNTALSFGERASASATGLRNTAIAIGGAATGGGGGDPERMMATGAYAQAGGERYKLADGTDAQVAQSTNNTSIAIGSGAQSISDGVRSTAYSFGTRANADARGVRNTALSFGTEASAQAVGGRNNTAIAIGNPAEVEDGGSPDAERAFVRSQNTLAIAGNLRGVSNEAGALIDAPEQTSDNNTAIAIGNGTRAGAGDGSNNYASALGNRSVAGAVGGNWNRAFVFGNDSTASAGRPIERSGGAPTLRAEVETSNNNTATVVGNGSQAVAGNGSGNRASVFGNRSIARAFGERQRVTSIGNDVTKPPRDEATK